MDNTQVNHICCSACSCKYNDKEKCTAKNVNVGDKNAKASAETECVTFAPKMS